MRHACTGYLSDARECYSKANWPSLAEARETNTETGVSVLFVAKHYPDTRVVPHDASLMSDGIIIPR